MLRVNAHRPNESYRQSKYCRKSNAAIVVWLKSKNGRWTSNNITAHLLISACSKVTLRGPPCGEDIVSRSVNQECSPSKDY
jgi:hypothetical protein